MVINLIRLLPLPLFFIGLTISLASTSQAQNWSGILAADRASDWSIAGAGVIPSRSTICTTLSPGATAAQINTAIANCPANQVVYLNAGTYNLSSGLLIKRDNVTLRGAGPSRTILNFTGSYACGGGVLAARVCVQADNLHDIDTPQNVRNWTAGYAKGTTQITLDSVANLAVGSMMLLDQTDDSSTDTNTIWINDTPGVACYDCASPSRNGNRAQIQAVTVTAINGNVVTIDPPVMWPNIKSSKAPQAWYPSNDAAVRGVGIEDLSITNADTAPAVPQTITMYNATRSWVRNVKATHIGEKGIRLYQSTHITIRDSYFYDKQGSDSSQEGSESYGVDAFMSSSWLVENNIFHHITSPLQCESGVGGVMSYNYTFDDFYNTSNPDWAQASSYVHGVCAYNLYEGNHGFGFISDIVHSSNFLHTNFRNRYQGWDAARPLFAMQTVPIHIYAGNRYQNVIGNVLGTSIYHTQYESYPGAAGNCDTSIYAVGFGGNCGNGSIANKLNTRTTLMRWGNWDTVNASTRFVSGEVPSADAIYPNPVPGSTSLPASFYLPGKPGWWSSSTPFPAIGPDVSGGNVTGVGGHAYKIPAMVCYESSTKDVLGMLTNFDGNLCYGNSNPQPAPAPPSGVSAIVR
ncbi:MAG TPA: glycosyl hydrolase family 28-related protein [Candidatus Nanoarchaeia archaeon]|nr:glycosyl hydrolase family 28-related protein [Candidatus Nanoarchaeia archaeon]